MILVSDETGEPRQPTAVYTDERGAPHCYRVLATEKPMRMSALVRVQPLRLNRGRWRDRGDSRIIHEKFLREYNDE